MMMTTLSRNITVEHLSNKTTKAMLGQVLFVSIALILPLATHKLGLNYLVAQPMHWMVIFAGLSYGASSGMVIGAVVPVLSFLLSGMPAPAVLPLMIPELMVYGLLSGLLKKHITAFGSVALALILGKVAYVAFALIFGTMKIPLNQFIILTWKPGILTMLIQIAALPILSGLYINWTSQDSD